MTLPAMTHTTLDVADMARLLKIEPGTLHRLACRKRLEAGGCPPPVLTRPLRWPSEAVLRWLSGGVEAPPAAEPLSADALWREKLNADLRRGAA